MPERPGALPVVALVLGLLGCIPGLGLVGILLGVVHLARGRGRPGRGLAVAGILGGAVFSLAWVAGGVGTWSAFQDLKQDAEAAGLYEVDLETRRSRLVFDEPGPEGCAAYVPGQDTMIFTRGAIGARDLYRVGLDGTGLTPLATTPEDELDPAVSPNGTSLAFVRREGGTHALWVGRLDGSEPVALVEGWGSLRSPAWSPESDVLVFVGREGPGNDDAYAVDLEGGPPEPVLEWFGPLARLTQVKAVDWKGRHLAVGTSTGIAVLDVETNEVTNPHMVRNLTSLRIAGPNVLFVGRDPDRGELFEGVRGVHAAPLSGGPTRIRYQASSMILCFALSPDGRRILLPMAPPEEVSPMRPLEPVPQAP